MDVVHLALTVVAIVGLGACVLAERLRAGAFGSLASNFAAVSTVLAVLGFGLLARDCLRSGTCAPSPQVAPHAPRLDVADPRR